MANWINFNVVGGFDGGVGSDPSLNGDNLLLAESIISVAVAETASRMTASDTCTEVFSERCGEGKKLLIAVVGIMWTPAAPPATANVHP